MRRSEQISAFAACGSRVLPAEILFRCPGSRVLPAETLFRHSVECEYPSTLSAALTVGSGGKNGMSFRGIYSK